MSQPSALKLTRGQRHQLQLTEPLLELHDTSRAYLKLLRHQPVAATKAAVAKAASASTNGKQPVGRPRGSGGDKDKRAGKAASDHGSAKHAVKRQEHAGTTTCVVAGGLE